MRLEELGKTLMSMTKGRSTVVVTDKNVEKLYLSRCVNSLKEAGFQVDQFVVEPGEESKSGRTYLELLNFLASIPLTRTDFLVALGGGVVGDLTGFAAATYLRGIEVVQVPTTLLASVDSSIGGKTGINLEVGKNLAGAFHQPLLVWQDSSLLKTLPEDIFKDGMAEVIKYAVLQDRMLFSKLKDVKWTINHMDEIIKTCVSIKKAYVEEDEFDHGKRQLLNFGHTIGHAIEKATDYEVSHGSAVAKGMLAIAKIAKDQGWCNQKTVDEIREILHLYGFDLHILQTGKELYEMILSDKKRKGAVLDLVVPYEVGDCRLKAVTIEELKGLLWDSEFEI